MEHVDCSPVGAHAVEASPAPLHTKGDARKFVSGIPEKESAAVARRDSPATTDTRPELGSRPWHTWRHRARRNRVLHGSLYQGMGDKEAGKGAEKDNVGVAQASSSKASGKKRPPQRAQTEYSTLGDIQGSLVSLVPGPVTTPAWLCGDSIGFKISPAWQTRQYSQEFRFQVTSPTPFPDPSAAGLKPGPMMPTG